MKIKVILSTGIGPLHLIKSAIFLLKLVDIKLIQSWIPKNTNSLFVQFLSKVVGHKHLSTGLKKRSPIELEGRNYSCATPDFLLWGLKIVSKKTGFPKDTSVAGWAWNLYGKESRKYIKDAHVFHVRSGAGQGGAIKKAKKEGMKVVVDHSIAHPKYMDKHLAVEYKKNNAIFNLGMDAPLFQNTHTDAIMADVVLVNSFFVKQTFIEEGFSEDKIKVAYLGVREDFIGLKKNYVAKGKIKLLFTGGFGFRKGAEYLLQALQFLEKEGVDFEMKVVGTYAQAKPLIDKYPLNSIEYVGFIPQDELKSYLSESDIYVFPSLCEGCASSGMEAMAAGLPVIATAESGFPIEHGIDGLIIPSKNKQAIVEAILQLIASSSLRAQLGKKASSKIADSYGWDDYANKVYKIYKNMLND
jgi:glycosyltransferase involved in cell wall biosynthesis